MSHTQSTMGECCSSHGSDSTCLVHEDPSLPKPNKAKLRKKEEEPNPQQEVVDAETLQRLTAVMSQVCGARVNDEQLKESVRSASADPQKLLDFFICFDELRREDEGRKRAEAAGRGKNSTRRWMRWASAGSRLKVGVLVTGQTCRADEAMKTKMENVEFTEDLQECAVIVVFCPISSRVGSDVEAAMRKCPCEKKSILVLMHHTRDVDYSTGAERWADRYPNVLKQVHVLFHETHPGLLTCRANDQALAEIHKVLNKLRK